MYNIIDKIVQISKTENVIRSELEIDDYWSVSWLVIVVFYTVYYISLGKILINNVNNPIMIIVNKVTKN